jgi:hypothetical protein
MSTTPEDAWREAAYDQMVEDILEDHQDEIIGQFVAHRMASYYVNHPSLLSPAVAVLEEARKLKGVSPSACLVFAQATVEIAMRDAVLKPVVFGMLHNDDNTGSLIAELAVENKQFTKLLFSILETYGINLKEIKRAGSSISVWEEMTYIKKARNNTIHRGKMLSEQDSLLALKVAEAVVEKIFPHMRKQFIVEL